MFNLSLLGLFRGFVLDFVKKQLHAAFQTIYDTRTNRAVQFMLIRQISCLDKHQNATCFSQKETAPCLLLVSWSLNPYDSLLQVTYIIQLVQFVVPFLHGISSWFLMLDIPNLILLVVNLFFASKKKLKKQALQHVRHQNHSVSHHSASALWPSLYPLAVRSAKLP